MRNAFAFESQVSLIAACRRFFPGARSIIFVGGEKFGLIRLDAAGAYRGARTNSSCAAGTGSFLDQQARRLGFPASRSWCAAPAERDPRRRRSRRDARSSRAPISCTPSRQATPWRRYATVCATGLPRTSLTRCCGGERPEPPVVFAGGVALNARGARAPGGDPRRAPSSASRMRPMLGAIGAALLPRWSRIGNAATLSSLTRDSDPRTRQEKREYFFEPLDLGETGRAAQDGETRYSFDAGSVLRRASRSRSTFIAHIDPAVLRRAHGHRHRVHVDKGDSHRSRTATPVAGFYTRTLGSPLTAVQAICEAIEDWQARTGRRLRFLGVGTTGRGQEVHRLRILKADLVVDEITAHARAAYALDPRIDTIIEIGGQDAKFTTMRDGMVTFSHMNTVCAAGTGSFLEEQAQRSGLRPRRLRAQGAGRARAAVERPVRRVHGAGHQQLPRRRVSPRRRSSPRRCTACGRTT